jgi:hypothetical protein
MNRKEKIVKNNNRKKNSINIDFLKEKNLCTEYSAKNIRKYMFEKYDSDKYLQNSA